MGGGCSGDAQLAPQPLAEQAVGQQGEGAGHEAGADVGALHDPAVRRHVAAHQEGPWRPGRRWFRFSWVLFLAVVVASASPPGGREADEKKAAGAAWCVVLLVRRKRLLRLRSFYS